MKKFQKQLQQQFNKLCATGKLFRSSVDGQMVWDTYIDSFLHDPIYRDPESSTHNCNLCNNFFRRYGNIVAIDEDFNVITMFDFTPEETEYIPVVEALARLLRNAPITDVFFETYESLKALPYESFKRTKSDYRLGIHENVKRYNKAEAELYPDAGIKEGDIKTFTHASVMVPSVFVKKGEGSIGSITSDYRDAKNVFQRTMEEIPADTLMLVIDLIKQGSLLDGDTHLSKIEAILPFVKQYAIVPDIVKDNWLWKTSYNLSIAKFKNSLIGVLCTELAEGMELNKACQNWNKRVDPANYMKAKAPITQRQIEEAKLYVDENGYTSAFERRIAT